MKYEEALKIIPLINNKYFSCPICFKKLNNWQNNLNVNVFSCVHWFDHRFYIYANLDKAQINQIYLDFKENTYIINLSYKENYTVLRSYPKNNVIYLDYPMDDFDFNNMDAVVQKLETLFLFS